MIWLFDPRDKIWASAVDFWRSVERGEKPTFSVPSELAHRPLRINRSRMTCDGISMSALHIKFSSLTLHRK